MFSSHFEALKDAKDHSFSTFAKFSEKLTFTPYAHVRMGMSWQIILVFRNCDPLRDLVTLVQFKKHEKDP